MPLLKGTSFETNDWTTLGADDPLPVWGNVIVPLARLAANPQLIETHQGELGVSIANKDRIETLLPFLKRLALIMLVFPAFSDGRAYSQARQIREQGFTGEMRAFGDVLPDQLQFMLQVGFDSFEVNDRFSQDTWLKASRQMSLAYQRGFIRPAGQAEVWTERHLESGSLAGQPKAG